MSKRTYRVPIVYTDKIKAAIGYNPFYALRHKWILTYYMLVLP